MNEPREKMFGCVVTVNPRSTKHIPYTLTGPRGGVYRLVRFVRNPRLMYVINKWGSIVSIKDNYTFADDEPKGLRPAYACNLNR